MNHSRNYDSYEAALEAALEKLEDLRLTLEDIRAFTPREALIDPVRYFSSKIPALREELEHSQAYARGRYLVRMAEELEAGEYDENRIFSLGELIEQAKPSDLDFTYRWLARAWETSTIGDALELRAQESWVAGSVGHQAALVLSKYFDHVKERFEEPT